MIASLPMYDLPSCQAANDRLWQAFVEHYGAGPEGLTRGADPWQVWQARDLLLAQTCGLPYRAKLQGKVRLVASPDHGLSDCPAGYYFSYLIRRRGDARSLADLSQGIMAYNEGLSQSGWAAPLAHLATAGLAPAQVLQTGAHVDSVRAVATGKADYAAIDAVTLTLVTREDVDLGARIDPFDRTTPTPALPFITAKDRDPKPIAAALGAAIAALDEADRKAIALHGIVQVPLEDYVALPLPPAPEHA
jgi:ABC-type phosphate/phosphonate transport system substrate-binding protein